MRKTITVLARPLWSSLVFNPVSIAVILILSCHLSGNTVSARVVISRRASDEGRANAMMEKPGINNNNSPGVVDDEMQVNVALNNEIDNSQNGHLRDAAGAVYNNRAPDLEGVKHVQHVPSNGRSDKPQQAALQEESSDETFESLEANREAFLEVLTENAKHPHRKRKNRKHSNFLLKFDEKLQRWSLTEQQSEEWFNV